MMERFQILLLNELAPVQLGAAGNLAQLRARVWVHLLAHGRAVQVDPVEPRLKAPVTKRLKLNGDILLSISAFKFNLRRYSMGRSQSAVQDRLGLLQVSAINTAMVMPCSFTPCLTALATFLHHRAS